MEEKNATLKDIAQRAGTSVTTVYRVLNNKEGVGDELRQRILDISKELGYTVNYAASSLSKKATNILFVFPKKTKPGSTSPNRFTTVIFNTKKKSADSTSLLPNTSMITTPRRCPPCWRTFLTIGI